MIEPRRSCQYRNYEGLLDDARFHHHMTGIASGECGGKRAWRLNKLQQSVPKSTSVWDWGKVIPQYDEASFGYGEVGVQIVSIQPACWNAGPEHQHMKCSFMSKMIFESHHPNIRKIYSFKHWMGILGQISIKRETACTWGYHSWFDCFYGPQELNNAINMEPLSDHGEVERKSILKVM